MVEAEGVRHEKGGATVAVAPEKVPPQRRTLPPQAVILHNGDFNTFEFVIETLQKVFGFGEGKAKRLAWEAHEAGRVLVWSGAQEHAELKAEQIRGRGADPLMAAYGALPLKATVEKMPG